MDYSMPVMKGDEAAKKITQLCEELRIKQRHQPYIACTTAYEDFYQLVDVNAFNGFQQTVRKPLEVSVIKNLMLCSREWQYAKKAKREQLEKQMLAQQKEFCQQ